MNEAQTWTRGGGACQAGYFAAAVNRDIFQNDLATVKNADIFGGTCRRRGTNSLK